MMHQPGQDREQQRGFLAWVADTIHNRGWLGAAAYYSVGAVELLRDLAPGRRKSRFGDIDYDFDHGVDTTWATVSLRTRLRELVAGAQYQPSEPGLFHEILSALPTPLDGFTFIDLGCGKGRTLLMASDYPFRKIVGVELLDELTQAARHNLQHYHSETQKCFDMKAITRDAREYEFPTGALVLYLFNPFPDYVLRAVLTNLHRSIQSDPREVLVIYHNLIHEAVFRQQTWLIEVQRTYQFAIYRAKAN